MPQANVAQLAEQRTRNAQVKSSNLFIGSIRGVAQLGSAFGRDQKAGCSNHPAPTMKKARGYLAFFILLICWKWLKTQMMATFWQPFAQQGECRGNSYALCLTKRSKHLLRIRVGLGLGQMGIYA